MCSSGRNYGMIGKENARATQFLGVFVKIQEASK